MSMDILAPERRPLRANLIALLENDLGEIAQFIANQSAKPPGNGRSASAMVPA